MSRTMDGKEAYICGTVLEQIIKYRATAIDVPEPLGGFPLWDMTPERVLLVMVRDWQQRQSGYLSQGKPFDAYYQEFVSFSELAAQVFSEDYMLRTLTLDGELCCLLGKGACSTGNFETELLLEQFRKFHKLLKDRLHIGYSIYLGDVVSYPDGLSASYQTAKYLIQYDEIMQTNHCILLPKDIQWRVSDSSRIIAVERKYHNCINARDYKKAAALAMELLSLETDASATNCINLKDRIIARADAALDSLNISYDGDEKTDSPVLVLFAKILKARTLREFRSLLPPFYEALDEHSSTLISNCSNRVINYIRSNYDNPGLCARMICSEFNISYHRLSKIINDYAGVGFNVFLHSLRLGEAKHLLQDTDAKIDVIAREVGFLTARTLNRAFIRYEEITPREYRRLHGKGNVSEGAKKNV